MSVAPQGVPTTAGGSGFVTLRRDKAYLCTRSVFVTLRRDKPNGRCSQGSPITAGKQYCEERSRFARRTREGSVFVTLRRDKAYLRTQSEAPGNYAMASNIASSWRVLARSEPRNNAMASNIARKGRVLQGEQEREHTFVCDRTVRRSKARDFPQDCLPQVWYSALIFTYS